MYLSFADKCIVNFIKPPSSFIRFLKKESLIEHQVEKYNEDTPCITIEFFERLERYESILLHPNAFFDNKGFGFLDKNRLIVYSDYCTSKIFVENNFSPSFLWDIIFDKIKILLLEQGIATIHAAAFGSNVSNTILFGWDGAGKSSLLLKNINKGAHYIGDDRMFIGQNQTIYPLFKSIKQFHHELSNFRSYLSEIEFTRRFIIKLSISLNQVSENSTIKLISLFSKSLLKIFRKLSLNFITIRVHNTMEKPYSNINQTFIVNKGTPGVKTDYCINSLTANILADDTDMIRRYNTYKFYPKSNKNMTMESYEEKINIILSMAFHEDNFFKVFINDKNTIENIELCSQ